jgi:hypothetical protein
MTRAGRWGMFVFLMQTMSHQDGIRDEQQYSGWYQLYEGAPWRLFTPFTVDELPDVDPNVEEPDRYRTAEPVAFCDRCWQRRTPTGSDLSWAHRREVRLGKDAS